MIKEAQLKDKELTTLRLAPYTCFLNPIEKIWALMKQSMRKENCSARLASDE